MRKSVFILLLLSTIPFVSCRKDNPEEGLLAVDDASAFIGHFVSLDEDGQVVLHLSGHLLNEADPTEISYCADTWEQALKMTKGWLPENARYQETETSLTWEMHDVNGVSQGNLVLTQKTGGLVAEAVLPAGTPNVRTIRFIPRISWPQNATELDTDDLLDEYFYGNVVNVKKAPAGHDHGTGEFLVVREFDELKNEKGIMFRIPNKTYLYKKNSISANKTGFEEVKKRSRSAEEARIVAKLFKNDQDFFYKVAESLSDSALKPWYPNHKPSVEVFSFWQQNAFPSSDYRLKFPAGTGSSMISASSELYELDIYYFWVELNGSKTVLKVE